jgi:hypothetical protein
VADIRKTEIISICTIIVPSVPDKSLPLQEQFILFFESERNSILLFLSLSKR